MNILQLIEAFKGGKAVINPTAWKQGQVSFNAIVGVLTVVAFFLKGTPYEMSNETISGLSTGLLALGNWLFTVVSTDKIDGLGRASKPELQSGSASDQVAP